MLVEISGEKKRQKYVGVNKSVSNSVSKGKKQTKCYRIEETLRRIMLVKISVGEKKRQKYVDVNKNVSNSVSKGKK